MILLLNFKINKFLSKCALLSIHQYEIKISYDKVWHARKCALRSVRGSTEDLFALLPSYFTMLKKITPGIVTRILIDDKQLFSILFHDIRSKHMWIPFYRKACCYC